MRYAQSGYCLFNPRSISWIITHWFLCVLRVWCEQALTVSSLTLNVTKEDNCDQVTTFVCEATTASPINCNDGCNWYKNDLKIVKNGSTVIPNKYEQRIGIYNITLMIYNTNFSDEGLYQCSVGRNQSNYTPLKKGLKLTITRAMRCGEVTTLLCEVNPNTPVNNNRDCNWYKDNEHMLLSNNENKYEERVGVNNFSLMIYNSDISDNGIYHCNIGQEQSNYICFYTGFNQVKMMFVPPKNIYIEEENTQLPDIQCEVNCTPACNYTWTKIGQKTSINNTNMLSIGSVNRTNAGTYACIAENCFGSVSGIITIEILYGPDFLLLSPRTTSYIFNEGDDVPPITCSASCHPNCTYTWMKNKDKRALFNENGTIIIRNIQKGDAGQYTCTVTNPVLNGSERMAETVDVVIYYGPYAVYLSSNTTSYTINEDDQLPQINCSSECYPNCTYTWTQNGRNLNVSNDSDLNLGSIKRSASGEYQCAAVNIANQARKESQTIYINVY